MQSNYRGLLANLLEASCDVFKGTGKNAYLKGVAQGNNVDVIAFCAHHLHVPRAEKLDINFFITQPLQSLAAFVSSMGDK